MLNQEVKIKKRGHAPEKMERNKAIIALYICGFTQWEISRITHTDRRNLQKFIKKYKPKYLRETYHKIMDLISDVILNKKKK